MKTTKPIHFIITGGTIDSFYDGIKDTVTTLAHSAVPNYIKSLKLSSKTKFTEICMKDSRNLNVKDFYSITNTIEKSPYKKVIITHGTYTMPDTAKFLKAHLKRNDQTIVFTGSMIPLLGFAPFDASFNLGFAISQVNELPNGIYVCMNGAIFSPDEVVKLLYEGRFISVFDESNRKK